VLTFALDTRTPRKGNCCFRLKDLENKDGGEKTKTTEEANPTNPEHKMSVWLA